MQLVVENDTAKPYLLSLGGVMWATSSRRVPVRAFGFVHTSSEGLVCGVRPEMVVCHRGAYYSLPVPRLN